MMNYKTETILEPNILSLKHGLRWPKRHWTLYKLNGHKELVRLVDLSSALLVQDAILVQRAFLVSGL